MYPARRGVERVNRLREMSQAYAKHIQEFSRDIEELSSEHNGAAKEVAENIAPLVAGIRQGEPLDASVVERLRLLLIYARNVGTTYRTIAKGMGAGPSFEKI